MSVTFSASSAEFDYLNLNNRNAHDLLEWIGLPPTHPDDMCGEISARELAAKCRRRLWPESRNQDAALPLVIDGRVHEMGRVAGYLHGRTQELLDLCMRNLEGMIRWY